MNNLLGYRNGGPGELAPKEEVAKSTSGSEYEPIGAENFDFRENKENKLPVCIPIEQTPM